MLNSHPEVAIRGECWLFGPDCDVDTWLNLDAVRDWMQLPLGPSVMEHAPAELADRLRRALAEAVLRLHWRPGVRWVGDRTPYYYCRGLPRIASLFPDASIVMMVRDGRDVAVSHMFHVLRENRLANFFDDPAEARATREHHIFGRGEPVPLFSRKALEHFASRWVECRLAAEEARRLYGDRFLEVRYERLLESTEETLAEVYAFLGVRDEREIVERAVSRNDFSVLSGGRGRGEADPSSFYRRAMPGEWRQYFRPEDCETYCRIAGEMLIEAGYAVGASRSRDGAWT